MIAALDRVTPPPVALGLAALLASILAALVVAKLPVSKSVLLATALVILLIGLLHIKLTIYMIIFSMLLSPELGVGVVAGDRPVTIRFEDILLILVGVAWVVRAVYRKNAGLFRDSPLNRPILAYSATAVLATLANGWSHDINWLRALLFLAKYLEYFVLYFLVLNNLRGRNDIRNYLIAAFVTCAVVSVMCISQIPGGGRVTAPFEGEDSEPNTLGGYLVFMLALASGFYFTASTRRERVLWLSFAALATLPLLYTLSRSSWLAGSIVAVMLLWRIPRKGQLLAAGAMAVALSPLFLPEQVVHRLEYTFGQPPEPGQIQVGRTRLDTSLSARIRSWQYGLSGWTQKPLIGHGVAGYGFMDAQYVRVLTETGLLGFAAFVWLAISIWRMARHRLHHAKDRFASALSLGYLAGFSALLVHGIGANTFIIVRIMEPFWLVTALVVALQQNESTTTIQEREAAPRGLDRA
ncbi:MAG: O-antigen ligase family protein [Vicinamibacteria bacterium]